VQLEEMVRKCVHAAVPIKQYMVSSNQFFSLENVALVPGEVYPEEEIRIIEVEADGLLTSRLVLSMTVFFSCLQLYFETNKGQILI
jgi:hypothetical protein